jgi:hypothetical protein
MDEKSMRGRALRPLTSVSLSSDSLYDFIALLVVNPENQEAMNDSMKQSPANLGGWQGQAGSNRKKKIDQQARTSVFEDCVGGKANPRTEGNPSASDELRRRRRGAQAAHQQSAIQFWRVAWRVSDARGRGREN